MSIMRRIKVLNSVTKEPLSLWCHHRKHQLQSRICESNKKYQNGKIAMTIECIYSFSS